MAGSKYNLTQRREVWLFDYKAFTPEELVQVRALEKQFYNEVLDRVIANPRFYLDNLDKLDVFYVTFLYSNHKKE